MAQKNRFNHKRHKSTTATPRVAAPRPEHVPIEKRPPTQYGKPFILMEDKDKNTFEYAAGTWVLHSMNIAECRQACQVKELSQKVNGMTRYEIRYPLPLDS